MISIIQRLPGKDRLKRFGLLNVESRHVRGDMAEVSKILNEIEKISQVLSFTLLHNKRTRGIQLKGKAAHSKLIRGNQF